MTSEEKMLEEFEAYFNYQTEGWAEYSRESSTWVGIDEISATALALLNIRWEAWKASRESLVIELPEMIGMNQPFTGTPISEIRANNHFNDAIQKCRKSIHAAGVKTK